MFIISVHEKCISSFSHFMRFHHPRLLGGGRKSEAANKPNEIFKSQFLFCFYFRRLHLHGRRELNTERHKQDCNRGWVAYVWNVNEENASSPESFKCTLPLRWVVTSITHGTVPHKTNMKTFRATSSTFSLDLTVMIRRGAVVR
jgi:hypothetical protein